LEDVGLGGIEMAAVAEVKDMTGMKAMKVMKNGASKGKARGY